MKRWLRIVGSTILLFLLLGAGGAIVLSQMSRLPADLDMGSDNMQQMDSMQMSAPEATAVTQLVAPPSNGSTKTFTLTAQSAKVDLGQGNIVDALTFNGTAPGPVLRVQQGDTVVVHLVNQLTTGVTIHWHGVAVPNAMDGVAGVTQDAVKPGETFTYRFIAKDAGAYWYHSHQESHLQVPQGLYGMLVVEPKEPASQYDHDYTIDLHEWSANEDCFTNCAAILTVNGKRTGVELGAKPGEWVRLRILNSGQDIHEPVLLGAAAQVIALDGQSINQPAPLTNPRLPIGPAQRYDLAFQMPAQGAVQLLDADTKIVPADQHPAATIGDEAPHQGLQYPAQAAEFDFTHYGAPQPGALTTATKFDATYSFDLGNHLGFLNGGFTMLFTMNEQTFPHIPMISVQPGQIIKVHFNNPSDIPHPMHLHGHTFTVLTKNGQALTGSPIRLDTLLVRPGETYDIAIVADNPGLWMLHCHILRHAAQGMDMMLVYPNISTPFRIGSASGNHPE